ANNLGLAVTDNSASGYNVLKTFEDNEITAGPVVEAIKAGSSNVTISSTGEDTENSQHQGVVTISVEQSVLGGELPIETVRLDGPLLGYIEDVTSISFPASRDTSYRAKVSIPSGLSSSVDIQLRFWLLAESAGTLPALTLTARVVPRPDPTGTPVLLPTSDSSVDLDFSGITTTIASPGNGKYVEITSDSISADPGAAIWLTLSRSGTSDGYNDEVHIIDQRAVLA